MIHDRRFLHQGVSLGSPEDDILQIVSFYVALIFSLKMELRGTKTVVSTALSFYNTRPLIFMLINFFADK